jgi:hypothetical protein
MPLEIAAWNTNYLATDNPYELASDTLYEQYHDEDLIDLYHEEGKSALSPVLLSFATFCQALGKSRPQSRRGCLSQPGEEYRKDLR